MSGMVMQWNGFVLWSPPKCTPSRRLRTMPRYRVDVFLQDDDYGVVAHIGNVNVDAKNKREAAGKGYDWLWDERLSGASCEPNIIVQRIPKVKGQEVVR